MRCQSYRDWVDDKCEVLSNHVRRLTIVGIAFTDRECRFPLVLKLNSADWRLHAGDLYFSDLLISDFLSYSKPGTSSRHFPPLPLLTLLPRYIYFSKVDSNLAHSVTVWPVARVTSQEPWPSCWMTISMIFVSGYLFWVCRG